MQSFEALISFLFFVFVCSYIIPSFSYDTQANSLYHIQLAEDAWRVLYLRDNFKDFDDPSRPGLEKDLDIIKEQTGLCVFIDGIVFTSCRNSADKVHSKTVSITKTVIYDGQLTTLTLSLQT
ncbi:hypothetical protein KKF81_04560 [Candidatus Micrarchaeota archaeon]|nr:hypothetical protein [Candidatus Micrarchaeota archaeon]MBU1166198.1 hypothetical protein [Candidatus Micrarchaeota archaeon]MBU1887129.1 hypothetical protein [Candidatus Micrarchaeota archaeon]